MQPPQPEFEPDRGPSAGTVLAERFVPEPSCRPDRRRGRSGLQEMPSPSRARRHAGTALAAAAYVVLAVAGLWEAWSRGASHVLPCGCFDQAQSAWFLSWVPYALGHGHNPLFTTWLDPPLGVNLMDNASMPLLGLLLAPVTLGFGPAASWNVLATLSLAGSGMAAFCVLRRWAPWWPAAFAGGLVYGFGPYLATQSAAHLNLAFAVFPPLALWFVDAIVVRQHGAPWRWGVALGLCSLAQLLVSTEILATSVLMAAVAVVALVIVTWPAVRGELGRRARWLGTAAGSAAAVFAAGAAYPLWMALFGPQQIAGHETQDPGFLSANLLGYVLPSSNQYFTVHATRTLVDPSFVGGFLAENTTYVGLGLLGAALVTTVALWRRVVAVRVAAVCAAVAGVLALGPMLLVGRRAVVVAHHHVLLPAWVLGKLPLLSDVIPARLSLYVDLCLGLLLAVGIDRLHGALARGAGPAGHDPWSGRRTPSGRAGGVRRRLWQAVAFAGAWLAPLAVAAVALLPIVPAWPIPMRDAGVPSFFTSPALRSVPAGSVALVYPVPRVTHAQAMLWQADAGMRFRMLGGFVLTPDGHGGSSEFGTGPGPTERALDTAYWTHNPVPTNPADLAAMRAELRAHHVDTLIAAPLGADPAGARTLLSAIAGRPPRTVGGIWLWRRVGAALGS